MPSFPMCRLRVSAWLRKLPASAAVYPLSADSAAIASELGHRNALIVDHGNVENAVSTVLGPSNGVGAETASGLHFLDEGKWSSASLWPAD